MEKKDNKKNIQGSNVGMANLLPYWFLLFTIGFAWFILAPLIPALIENFNVGLSAILLIISTYGYTMVILGLLAGYIAAKFTVRSALYGSALISIIGLVGRALAPDYAAFLIMGIIAAIAYPLAMAPVGSISESISKEKAHTIVGVSVGILFLGMAFGAFFGPGLFDAFSLSGVLWITALLSILAGIWIAFGIKGYPTYYKGKSLKGTFKWGMLKNWYIGFAIAAISVMFGSVASTVLLLHNFSKDYALALGGLLGGLAFLGSALGAIILPPLFEKYEKLKTGIITTAFLMFVSAIVMSMGLAYTTDALLIAVGFFFFGFFGNAFWSMALTSTTNYVSDPAQAGFATSMYSVVTNLGVAIIPVILGVYFGSMSTIYIGVIAVVIIEFIALVIAPELKTNKK
ncbi:MAG: MFS transporter [Candidatus Micrarchaeia archaeon]